MISSLSLLIPAYNAEQTILPVLTKARAVIATIAKNREIIVLDDGSTDATPRILADLSWKELTILRHETNQGYGKTIRDLYYAATKAWLVTLPSDDQIDPEEIHKLVTFHEQGDMILGKRSIRHDHMNRRIQSSVYNTLLRLLFRIPTTDANTIRLMKREILDHIALRATSAFVDAELIIAAQKAGYAIEEVPIAHKPRTTPGATGGKFFKTILPTIQDMIRYRMRR